MRSFVMLERGALVLCAGNVGWIDVG